MTTINTSINNTSINKLDSKVKLSKESVKYNDDIKSTAKDFDALILNNMLSQLNESQEDGLFGKSFADDMYKDMLNQEYSKVLAEKGDMGFSNLFVEQYSKKE